MLNTMVYLIFQFDKPVIFKITGKCCLRLPDGSGNFGQIMDLRNKTFLFGITEIRPSCGSTPAFN